MLGGDGGSKAGCMGDNKPESSYSPTEDKWVEMLKVLREEKN